MPSLHSNKHSLKYNIFYMDAHALFISHLSSFFCEKRVVQVSCFALFYKV